MSEPVPTDDNFDAVLLRELRTVRERGFWGFRARECRTLAGLCGPALDGEPPEAPIQRRLLDLIDPEPVDDRGRKLGRIDLEKRDHRDRGLFGRILFGEPRATITFPGAGPGRTDLVLNPSAKLLTGRYSDLALLRGVSESTINKSPKEREPRGGQAHQFMLDLIDALRAGTPTKTSESPRQPDGTHDCGQEATTIQQGVQDTESLTRHSRKRWAAASAVAAVGAIAVLTLIGVWNGSPNGRTSQQQEDTDWGPRRATFTWAHPASYNTFDSIINNPVVGDERRFLSVYELGSRVPYRSMQVRGGEQVIFRAYYGNDVAANLNLVARDTRIAFELPSGPSTTQIVHAAISAANSRPPRIWDTIHLTASHPFILTYRNAIWNNTLPSRTEVNSGLLSNQIVTPAGVLLGCTNESPDGYVSGAANCAGWVAVEVRVRFT